MVEAGGLGSAVNDQHDLGVATGGMAQDLERSKTCGYLLKSLYKENLSSTKKVADELGITIPSVLKDAGQNNQTKETITRMAEIWLWQVPKS